MVNSIAVDVDGVLADVISVWLDRYGRGKVLSKDQVSRWDFWRDLGYNEHRFYLELAECWYEWHKIPLMEPDIPLYIRMLRSIAESVDIVSAQIAKESVVRWLEHNGIEYDKYVSVARGVDKAYLNYDIFIDDSPINALSIASIGKKVLLYDQPWNRHVDLKSIVRIKSLKDAIEIVR